MSQDRSLWDTVLQTSESALLSITGRESEAAVLDKFHDYSYQVSIRNKPQKLAGQAAMPHGVIGCSEVHKDSTSLIFSRKTVLDFLGHQGIGVARIFNWGGAKV